MLSADGWYAMYLKDNAPDEASLLVCWALVEYGGETEIHGIEGSGEPHIAEMSDKFREYRHQSELNNRLSS